MTVGHSLGDGDRAQFHLLTTIRPRDRGVIELVISLRHLHDQLEFDGTTTNPLANLGGQIVWSHRRELLIGEEFLAADRQELVTTERGGSLRVGELKGVDTEIRQGCITDRCGLCRFHERFRGRMSAQKTIKGSWLRIAWFGRSKREEKIPELVCRGDGKAVERIKHDVGDRPARKMKFHRHAAWTRAGIGVWDSGKSCRVIST